MTSVMGESTVFLGIWRFLALFAILSQGFLLGRTLFPVVKWPLSLPLGATLFLALQSILQTGWYYVGGTLGWASDIGTLATATAVTLLFIRFGVKKSSDAVSAPESSPAAHAPLFYAAPFMAIALTSFAFILQGAARGATTESVRSAWPLLPPLTLVAIAALWITLILSCVFVRRSSVLLLHAILAISGTTFIAPLLYRVGYGFDGFLHVASETILLRTGTLSPKPLYYMGQYVFTTWLSRIADLPVASVDRWLVPLCAAVLIPLALYAVLRESEQRTDGDASPSVHARFLILTLVPLSAFIATTPQGFSYVLALSALLFATARRRYVIPALGLSLWAVAVHPLAGVPMVLIVVALSVRHRAIAWALVFLAASSIPLLFLAIGQHGSTAIQWDASSIFTPTIWVERIVSFAPWIGNHFVLWPAWATLVGRSIPVILLILSLFALRRTTDEDARAHIPMLIGAAALFWIVATILKTTGTFTFLIDYERGNYADRLNTLALLCLIPAAAEGIQRIQGLAVRASTLHRVAVLAFLAFAATGLGYDALPRHDALVTGHGWSVSSQDIAAVKSVDHDAETRDYTVLANQSVSAAAVQTLGFKRYTPDDVFFYPIPTGGPLYQVFLDVTYTPATRDTVQEAALLGHSNLVYVILNRYWWKAETVAEQLKRIANAHWEVDGGKVRVYKFDFNTDSSAPTATSTR